jgi:hypothetical protein
MVIAVHIGGTKALEDALGEKLSLLAETGVEHRLAAAGLVPGEVHLHTQLPQKADHAHPHFREELVNYTGDEERHLYLGLCGHEESNLLRNVYLRVTEKLPGGNTD